MTTYPVALQYGVVSSTALRVLYALTTVHPSSTTPCSACRHPQHPKSAGRTHCRKQHRRLHASPTTTLPQVSARGYANLTTQLYFAGNTQFDCGCFTCSSRNPALRVKFDSKGRGKFNVVLAKLPPAPPPRPK